MGKSRKEISEIERGVGYLMGLTTALIYAARSKNIPFEALYRLVTPEGAATVGRIVELAHESWRESQDLEFNVHVEYWRPSLEDLNRTFRDDPVIVKLVNEMFDRVVQSRTAEDEYHADRTLVLKLLEEELPSRQVYFLGLRRADLFETYALARSVNGFLKAPFRAIATGAHISVEGRLQHIEFFKTLTGKCELNLVDGFREVPPNTYRLYVRENRPGSI